MVPWVLAAVMLGLVGLVKVYVDNNEHASHGDHEWCRPLSHRSFFPHIIAVLVSGFFPRDLNAGYCF